MRRHTRPVATQLPGQYIPANAIQYPTVDVPVVDQQSAVSMSDVTQVAGILVALGVDPISAGAVVNNIQAIQERATLESLHQVVSVVHQTQLNRALALSQMVASIPKVDAFNTRYQVAAVVGDPTAAVIPDPTPSLLDMPVKQ